MRVAVQKKKLLVNSHLTDIPVEGVVLKVKTGADTMKTFSEIETTRETVIIRKYRRYWKTTPYWTGSIYLYIGDELYIVDKKSKYLYPHTRLVEMCLKVRSYLTSNWKGKGV